MGKCQFAGGWLKWARMILQQKQSDQKSGRKASENKADPEKFGLINFLLPFSALFFCSITMLSFLLKKISPSALIIACRILFFYFAGVGG